MNAKVVIYYVGTLAILLGALMLVPFGLSAYFGEQDGGPFLATAAISLSSGFAMRRWARKPGEIGLRECFGIVTFGWIVAALLGCLPFLFNKTAPTFADAYFEAMSGLTTTGASILDNIESQPHGILFWRSLLHWLGGMGIIVLFITVLPGMGIGGTRLFRAEVPGVFVERLEPRIRPTARALWAMYVGLSVVMTLLLCLGGMDVFDAVIHTFGTMATGGYSSRQASVGAWPSPFIQVTIMVFMMIAGGNFGLYFRVLQGRPSALFRDPEFKLFVLIILVATGIVAWDVAGGWILPSGKTLLDAAFQVVSIITTTGFATVDFDLWPPAAKSVLFVLMFIGGCAGSTAGAIKVGRILIALKHGYGQIRKSTNPREVSVVKVNGTTVRGDIVSEVLGFIFLYVVVFVVSSLYMASLGLDLVSASTSVAATLGNVGPGLELVGPAYSYSSIPASGKWLLSFCMLLGRLKLYTVLVLLLPDSWRKP